VLNEFDAADPIYIASCEWKSNEFAGIPCYNSQVDDIGRIAKVGHPPKS